MLEYARGQPEFLFSLLALGDFGIDSQHADDFMLVVVQRHLGGAQPDGGAIRCGLRFFVVQLGLARLHDRAVIGSIQLGLVLPGHVEIGLANQILRIGKTGIVGEQRVAAQIA